MKREELIKLKKLYNKEVAKINRINELLLNDYVKEFIKLNNLNIEKLSVDDKWVLLNEILKDFPITESNGILVLTKSYLTTCKICYEDTNYYKEEVSFDNPEIEYQSFKDIETNKVYIAYLDNYIQKDIAESNRYYNNEIMTTSEFCHKYYKRRLVSELKKEFNLLNPYNSRENNNGFNEVRKDFFETALSKGQGAAKKLVLSKYPLMK